MSDQLQQGGADSAPNEKKRRRWYYGDDGDARSNLVWGLSLIAVGVIVLGYKLGFMDVDILTFWHLWPLIVAISGLANIVFAKKPAHVVSGIYHILAAGWLYACMEHLWGWTFGNTWPMILIAWGASILLRGAFNLSHDIDNKNKESSK
ncbi:LiaI-LiaF-like domain-containing protein [Undibacterium terreum]|uniref:LiaF transmembrane domain-containing protein n=1 Tax=Undibacterium terreum TaxID=1224302 RepID=A0A916XQR1_9BURK|nr:DUF5668 domain-containing protein [Undibacterium terreum]GGC96207.1 hypothetical protein GCM10011396_49520 [Undibacterium terreum]